jgi:RNA polymerase sigma-70 factor (ECF subfamily)
MAPQEENDRRDQTELIARLQYRDPDALAELYDRYGRLAHSLILRLVHDAAIAEDLVQETFLRAWNHVQYFDGHKGSIGPWLMAIARNRAIDYLRSVRNRDSRTVAFDETDSPAYTATESDVMTSDSNRLVRDAMRKLVPHHHRVIELSYFEGLTNLEVAQRMGQPLGTVKSWVRMALRRLREELASTAPALIPSPTQVLVPIPVMVAVEARRRSAQEAGLGVGW